MAVAARPAAAIGPQKATHKVTWKPSSQVTAAARPPVFSSSSAGGSPSTGGTTGKGVVASSSLVDLFSPKLLSSVKATKSSADGDYNGMAAAMMSGSTGSTIRETFVVLSGPLNIASIQEQSPTARDRRPSRNRYAPSSLGVGMPKTERAFLAAYAAKAGSTTSSSGSPAKRKQSVSPLPPPPPPPGGQTVDYEAARTYGVAPAPTESKFPSFMSPTLSYYSKLSARRASVDGDATASIIAPTSTFRRPSSFANPSSSSASSSAGPAVRLPTPKSPSSTDPAEFLGLDSAIEKLRAALHSKQLQLS